MTTRLLQGHAPGERDEQVCSALRGIPAGDALDRARLYAGILNGEGTVYRDVTVRGKLQLLHLTARLNAIGFQAVPPRGGRSRYAVLFARAAQRR